jgi:hypothetical protein
MTSGTPGGAPAPTWIGVIAGGLMLALGMFGLAITLIMAVVGSESDAVTVSYLGVPLALAGFVAPVVALIVRRQQTAVAVGAPIGCGCATMVFGVVAMVVFFTAIWPSL